MFEVSVSMSVSMKQEMTQLACNERTDSIMNRVQIFIPATSVHQIHLHFLEMQQDLRRKYANATEIHKR